MNADEEITEIVNRETKAWDTQDVELLLSIFHPDFVWVWPKDNHSPNPLDWNLPLGKFNYDRWKDYYSKMFSKYKLVKNNRKIVNIKISSEKDGAFAIVEVDTLWEDAQGKQMHWHGLAGKTYSKINGEWKLISHYGLLLF